MDARPYTDALLGAGGAQRLVWASDWPWTQHSEGLSYAPVLDWLDAWVPNPALREMILGDTPRELFGFNQEKR